MEPSLAAIAETRGAARESPRRAARYVAQILAGAAALAVVAAAGRGSACVDFAVYYAGGKAAAFTSYVDVRAVQRILRADGLPRSSRAPVPYGSPVLMATVFRPLGALPPTAARAVYFLGLAIVLLVTAWRLSPDGVGVMLFGLVLSGPYLRALTLGNWSVVTGCLVLWTYLDARDGRWLRSGGWLAAASLWKVYPLVAFVPYVVKGAWRVLALAAGVGVVVVATTMVVLRPEPFMEVVRYAFGVMRPDNVHAVNLSIPGVVVRLSGDAALASTIAWVSPLAVAASLWGWRRAPVSDLLALALVTMLLTGALTWDHYGTALFVFLPWLADQDLSAAARRAGIWLFAAAMVPWFLLVVEDPSSLATYLRFPTLPGALAMATFMAVVVHKKARAASGVLA